MAKCTRFLSPPESTPTFFPWSAPLKLNFEIKLRAFTDLPPIIIVSLPPDITSYTVLSGRRSSWLWSTYPNWTVSPIAIVPLSGFSAPMIIRNKVVLPTPLGPMIPTIPAWGNEKFKFSMSKRSPNPLFRFSDSITLVPKRGPGGMNISSFSSFSFVSSFTILS